MSLARQGYLVAALDDVAHERGAAAAGTDDEDGLGAAG